MINRYSVRPQNYVKKSQATSGSVRTAASVLQTVAFRYDTWLHVDAAYAGSTFIESKYREVA